MRPSPRLTALAVGDEPGAWREIGFAVGADGSCRLGGVAVVFGAQGRGVRAWAVDGADAAVDGLRAAAVPPVDDATSEDHPNGVVAVDHVVVTTPDLDRTVAALGAAGFEPRRTRNAGQVRQVFFRLGGPILELVGPPAPSGDGPARFFGLALTVADLDATAGHLGEHVGRTKDAVQPGRRIATLRRSAGLATAVAFLSPEPARAPR